MVSRIYHELRAALGSNCLLIGSYARFTAGRPLHDLDVLFIAGDFDPSHLSPQRVLTELHSALDRNFANPTKYQIAISQQSHSITISFLDEKREAFGVDVVPAFISGTKNEFGDDIYWVPEIVITGKKNRQSRYEHLSKTNRSEVEWWLKSDPRGYIKATTELNSDNSDFRKAAKFIKRWKHTYSAVNEDFKLKSFHIEQVLYGIFTNKPGIEIADAVFEFFCALPDVIARPQVRDRADQAKFVDQYLKDLTEIQKRTIVEARDFYLSSLEDFSETSSVSELLSGKFRKRTKSEEFLYDFGIPVFLESDVRLKISGNVLPREGGFRPYILDALGIIPVDRKIQFNATAYPSALYDLLKWKVKNDDSSPQPRGEITDHTTRNNPERTQYRGSHFVECYAIRNGICIARARQNVVLG